jgi:hypothetical protein
MTSALTIPILAFVAGIAWEKIRAPDYIRGDSVIFEEKLA